MSAISSSGSIQPPTGPSTAPSGAAAPAAAAASSPSVAAAVTRSSSAARHSVASTLAASSASSSSPAAGYRFSDNVLREVMQAHGLTDADAVLAVAVRLDNHNRYLNRAELEAAAREVVASGAGSGGAGARGGPIDPDALRAAIRGVVPGYRYSLRVVGDVMERHALSLADGPGLMREAVAHDNQNRYLSRGELTAAADAITAGPAAVTASTVGTGVITDLRVSPGAVGYTEAALAQLTQAQASDARTLLREAAGTDGNRVLTLAEAQAVIEPILNALPGGGADVRAAIAEVDRDLDCDRAREAAVRDDVDVLFNSTPASERESMSGRIVSELDDTIAVADGRRVDINAMIFSFTDTKIADKLVDLAINHPNANVRVMADWTQTSTANGYKPAILASLHESEATVRAKYSGRNRDLFLAARARYGVPPEGLANLQVHFKKDQPYRWDARAYNGRGGPKFDHGSTRGLNHHKGLVTLIDGKPRTLVSGSFNWSPTAETKNYENLMVLGADAGPNRSVMRSYEEEFEAYWNDGKASLTHIEAQEHKRLIFDAIGPNVSPQSITGLDHGAGDSIAVLDPEDVTDLNGWTNGARIAALLGGGQHGLEIASAMQAERLRYGAFTDLEDLKDRIPAVADLDPALLDRIRDDGVFGGGQVQVNDASAEQLMALGASRPEADAIIAHRAANGDFESLDDLSAVAGLSASTIGRIGRHLTTEMTRVAFSARRMDEAAGDAGYAASNEARTVPVMGAGGVVRAESATLGAGALDMIHRTEAGDTLELATYGLSSSTAEYAALVSAARRGVKLRVILNKAYNESVADHLRELKSVEGLDVEVKVSGRTMHQKYLVNRAANDVFNGSANLSGSSQSKHSEDRFFIKNNPAVTEAFAADFTRLWDRLHG